MAKIPPIVRTVHPSVSFGRACFEGTGVPVFCLAGPVFAGDSPDKVARWYGVPVAHVREAVRQERERKRRKVGEHRFYPASVDCPACDREDGFCAGAFSVRLPRRAGRRG